MGYRVRKKKPFFLVWNPHTGQMIRRHKIAELAAAEAVRLSEKEPGKTFHVLMPIGKAKK